MIRLPFQSFAVLVLVVLLGLWPAVPAWAEPTPSQPAGSGTAAAPYLIGTLAELYWIAASDAVVASPNRATRWAAHYRQTASIDASDTATWDGNAGWTPIGASGMFFSGSYDGDGHFISGLFMNRPGGPAQFQGLFGYTDTSATITRLGLNDVNITGYYQVGGLVGHSLGTVNSCHVTGSVSGDTTVGGLAGRITGGTVANSFAAVTVIGQNNVGGLVGTITEMAIP